MAKVNSIDEHFFDFRGKPVEHLKKAYYILGAFYVVYTPYGDNGIQFETRYRDLSYTVGYEMNITGTAQKNSNGNYTIIVKNVPHLRARLEEIGLSRKKKDRKF